MDILFKIIGFTGVTLFALGMIVFIVSLIYCVRSSSRAWKCRENACANFAFLVEQIKIGMTEDEVNGLIESFGENVQMISTKKIVSHEDKEHSKIIIYENTEIQKLIMIHYSADGLVEELSVSDEAAQTL